jgi:hypothetical protein
MRLCSKMLVLHGGSMITYRDRCKSQITKINSRTIIYLDTKFWLTIRIVHINELALSPLSPLSLIYQK